MAMEAAFLKAIKVNPRSQLVKRVRRTIRKGQRADEEGAWAVARDPKALGHAAQQLGRKWAAYRLGGCVWMGPAEKLRSEWQSLYTAARDMHQAGARAALLGELFSAIGLGKRPLDRCARSYLFRVLEATPADWAYVCKLEGVRWFSPLSVLVEAVHELAGHTLEDKRDLRDYLSPRLRPVDDAVDDGTLRQLAAAVVAWAEARE